MERQTLRLLLALLCSKSESREVEGERTTAKQQEPPLRGIILAVLVAGLIGSCGTCYAGLIESWGRDYNRQVSNTPSGSEFIGIAGGSEHSLALTAGGSIVSWGSDNYGLLSSAPKEGCFTAVASGYFHSLALTQDGSIVSWGKDDSGQISDTPESSGFIAIDGGSGHSLALKSDGSIVSWGYDLFGQVSNTPQGTGFIAIAAGDNHSLALRADGSIVSWGNDSDREVSDTPTGQFVDIDGGHYHSLALTADGFILSWGGDDYNVVTDTPQEGGFLDIAAGQHHNLALRADGSIISWGKDDFEQVRDTPKGIGFTAIDGGGWHSLAIIPEPCTLALLALGGVVLVRRRKGTVPIACLLLIIVAGNSFAGEQRYLITDLTPLSTGYAFGINDFDQVVGISGSHAFFWSKGVLTDLGTAGGVSSVAYRINNNGQVAGKSETGETYDGHVLYTACLWESGTYTELPPLKGHISSEGYGINEDGLVVGHSKPASGSGSYRYACQWPGGALNPSGSSYSMAWGVNDAGDVVGEWDGLAVLWQQSGMTYLGTLEGGWSIARDINTNGQIVGESDGLAFLWQNGSINNLGLLPGHQHSEASAINDAGQIVGRSHASGWPDDHAVLWEDGQIKDLNTLIDPDSGWFLTQARDINCHGDIVGWGFVGNEPRAFLLTEIPEPCTLIFLGLGGLLAMNRQRR